MIRRSSTMNMPSEQRNAWRLSPMSRTRLTSGILDAIWAPNKKGSVTPD
jgi:hypothetical protein